MRYENILIGAALAVSVAFAAGAADKEVVKKAPIEVIYTVRQGDTLWSIARRYMDLNTYGSRDIREFVSGIVELNYDEVFKGREPGEIYPGDELRINYWTKDDTQ